jgi:hypothetical protein
VKYFPFLFQSISGSPTQSPAKFRIEFSLIPKHIGNVEAGLMCEVYSYCTVVIAASSALNGNGGCLFSRNTEARWVGSVEMVRKHKLIKYTLLNDGLRRMCIDDVPLSDRAVRNFFC